MIWHGLGINDLFLVVSTEYGNDNHWKYQEHMNIFSRMAILMIKHREINTNEDGEGWGDVGRVASWVKDSTGTKRCPSTEGLQSWLVQGPYLQVASPSDGNDR